MSAFYTQFYLILDHWCSLLYESGYINLLPGEGVKNSCHDPLVLQRSMLVCYLYLVLYKNGCIYFVMAMPGLAKPLQPVDFSGTFYNLANHLLFYL